MNSSWWSIASDEEKLAQITNGHELGLTQIQLAMNLKTNKWCISDFCTKHSIDFKDNGYLEAHRKSREKWKVEETTTIEKFKDIDNTRIDFAFTLFENNDNEWRMNLWDDVENG